MKKRWLVMVAALTMTVSLSASVLVGCGDGSKPEPPAHVHSYTQWDKNETQHWKICPDDNAIDESTRANHDFGSIGMCECGQAEPVKYGTASGQVKLTKKGQEVSEYSGVTVSVNDSAVGVDYDETKGTFTIGNAKVGTYYKLTVSKTGYVSYQTEFTVQEGQDTVIGGKNGVTLVYAFASVDRPGNATALDHNALSATVGGANTGPDGNSGSSSSKITLAADYAPASDEYFFDFTVTLSVMTTDGGGWRRFGITFTESDDGFLFIYNTNSDSDTVGIVRAVEQDGLDQDGGTDLPAFCNTLSSLKSGVKFRAVCTGTQIILNAYDAENKKYVKVATKDLEEDENIKVSFRGSYETWTLSECGKTEGLTYVAKVPPTETVAGTEAHFTKGEGEYINYYDLSGNAINEPKKLPVLVQNVRLTLSSSVTGETFSQDNLTVTGPGGEETTAFTVADNVVSFTSAIEIGTYTVLCTNGYYSVPATFTVASGTQEYTAVLTYDFALTENGDGVTIDNNDKTVTVGKNAGGTVDEATRKATLSPAFTPDGDKWVFDFTVKELNEKGAGGWRRFGVTLTEQGDGFIFLYNGGNKQVKAAKVTGLDMDVGGQFGGTDIGTLLDGLTAESGVALRAVRNGTKIYLYVVGADSALTKISELTCEANAAAEISFLGCWNDWQFSGVSTSELPDTAVTVTNDSVAGGTVIVTNESVKLYDDVVITVTPDSGYLLESLTVNGTNVTNLLENNTLTLTGWAETSLTIAAVFESRVTAQNVTFNLTGATLTEGDTVTVKDRKNNTQTYTVAEGALVIKSILAGECEVSYNGSPVVKVTVTENTTAINFTVTSGSFGENAFTSDKSITVNEDKKGFVTPTTSTKADCAVAVGIDSVKNEKYVTVDMHVRLTDDIADSNTWRTFDITFAGKTVHLSWAHGNSAYTIEDSAMPDWLHAGFVSGDGNPSQADSVLVKTGYDFRVVRSGATVTLYAKNDGAWVKLYETACDEDAETALTVTTGYCGWTVTDMEYGSVSATVTEQSESDDQEE